MSFISDWIKWNTWENILLSVSLITCVSIFLLKLIDIILKKIFGFSYFEKIFKFIPIKNAETIIVIGCLIAMIIIDSQGD